jgi:hypothetical protein
MKPAGFVCEEKTTKRRRERKRETGEKEGDKTLAKG